jgi:6-phosphofructokinase 2
MRDGDPGYPADHERNQPMQSIVTLTMNPSIDINSSVDHVVAERKLRCKPPRYEPGGGGINVSRAIQILGGESLALYPAGGYYGRMLQDLLDREGLNHSSFPIRGLTRETLIISEESTGQQFRFGMPGPTFGEAEWQHCLDRLFSLDPKADYVVASGSLPPGVPKDFYARIGNWSKGHGGKVIVDTSGEALHLALEAGVYLIKPNMRELGELANHEIEDEVELERVAMEMVERGKSEVVVVSLGAAGALMVSKDGYEHFRTPTVPIKSKVGAGDSMVAGIARSLAQGKTLREAVRFGVAAGAAAVMTPGTELCRREDTERLYQQMRADNP